MALMMAQSKISPLVIDRLWMTFGAKRELNISADQRRGALLILSMFAQSKPEIIGERIDVLLTFGLGSFAKDDLMLAKHACVALQQLVGKGKKKKGSLMETYKRFSLGHPVCKRLFDLILEPSNSKHWFCFAEQAIGSVYLLSEHPDVICGEIIQKFIARVFQESAVVNQPPVQMETQIDETMETNSFTEIAVPSIKDISACDPLEFSKLLFVVGHVSIKQMVHLENIESEWKRRKAQSTFICPCEEYGY